MILFLKNLIFLHRFICIDWAIELGADEVIVSENDDEMNRHEISLDLILCTIPDSFDVNPYICLLKPHGELITVGMLGPYKTPTDNMEVAKLGRSVSASLIDSVEETQEVLDFCAEHQILAQVEMISMEEINMAFEKVLSEDVRFLYVIDMQSQRS